MQAFAKQVSEYTKAGFDIDLSADAVDLTYSVALHNAIVLYAHAATKVLAAGGDLHDGRAVTEAVRNTTFVGVGHSIVDLDQHGDRIESYEVMNYVKGADGGIESVAVGVYNRTLQQYVAYEREVEWPGCLIKVPLDFSSGDPCMPRLGSWRGTYSSLLIVQRTTEHVSGNRRHSTEKTWSEGWFCCNNLTIQPV